MTASDGARFRVIQTPLASLQVVERRRIGDERGFISRVYSAQLWRDIGLGSPVVEVNHALTRQRGTVRGMHFQTAPASEDKFLTVLRGSIFDVAVDLRQGSPTLARWHGETLSAENRRAMLIPKGFAHGFQTLEDDCELLYLHTAAYDPALEGGISALDPTLAISWPLPIAQMSDRDQAFALLERHFAGIMT